MREVRKMRECSRSGAGWGDVAVVFDARDHGGRLIVDLDPELSFKLAAEGHESGDGEGSEGQEGEGRTGAFHLGVDSASDFIPDVPRP